MTKLWFYNGNDITAGQGGSDLGIAFGENPKDIGRGQRITPRSSYSITLADSSGKRLCCPVLVGDEVWLYYEGYDGTRFQIFLEVYGRNGGLRYRHLVPVVPNTAIASTHSVSRPSVLYEPTDTGAEFKMVMARGVNDINATELVAATSSDGIRWTILGTMIGLGSGWESTYLTSSGRIVNDSGTYRVFYSGKGGNPLRWKSGEIHRTGFGASGWTRHASNPLLNPRGASQGLSGTVAVGGDTVAVQNTAAYDVGAPIIVYDPGVPPFQPNWASYEWNVIAEKLNATTLRVRSKFSGGYPGATSTCVQIHSGSVDMTEVWLEAGTWKGVFTAFEFMGYGVETTGYAETTNLANGFTIDPTVWPLPMVNKFTAFDRTSAENFKFVNV